MNEGEMPVGLVFFLFPILGFACGVKGEKSLPPVDQDALSFQASSFKASKVIT